MPPINIHQPINYSYIHIHHKPINYSYIHIPIPDASPDSLPSAWMAMASGEPFSTSEIEQMEDGWTNGCQSHMLHVWYIYLHLGDV